MITKEIANKIYNLFKDKDESKTLIYSNQTDVFVTNKIWLVKIPLKYFPTLPTFGPWTESKTPDIFFGDEINQTPSVIETKALGSALRRIPKEIKTVNIMIECPECEGSGFVPCEGHCPDACDNSCYHKAARCTLCGATGKIKNGKTYLDYVPIEHHYIKCKNIYFDPYIIEKVYYTGILVKSDNIYYLKERIEGPNRFQIEDIEILIMPTLIKDISDYTIIELKTKYENYKLTI